MNDNNIEEKELNLKEIVMRLVGSIDPEGDSITDEVRLKALKSLCHLVNELVAEINSVIICNRHSHESSRKIAFEYANKFLADNFNQSDTLTQYKEALRELVEDIENNLLTREREFIETGLAKAKQLLNNE